ncbi:helix-turn-helix domain-containing protein [Hydrogenophaga soli]
MDYPIQLAAQLAQQLPAFRKACGLSQAALGARLNLSQSRVAYIERNPAAISVQQLFDILQVLGVQLLLRTPLTPGVRPDADTPPPAQAAFNAEPPQGEW